MSSVFHLSMVGFTVSHIIQHHYILWTSHFQTVNPKVNNTYIIVKLPVFQGYVCQPCTNRLSTNSKIGYKAFELKKFCHRFDNDDFYYLKD